MCTVLLMSMYAFTTHFDRNLILMLFGSVSPSSTNDLTFDQCYALSIRSVCVCVYMKFVHSMCSNPSSPRFPCVSPCACFFFFCFYFTFVIFFLTFTVHSWSVLLLSVRACSISFCYFIFIKSLGRQFYDYYYFYFYYYHYYDFFYARESNVSSHSSRQKEALSTFVLRQIHRHIRKW